MTCNEPAPGGRGLAHTGLSSPGWSDRAIIIFSVRHRSQRVALQRCFLAFAVVIDHLMVYGVPLSFRVHIYVDSVVLCSYWRYENDVLCLLILGFMYPSAVP